VFANGVLSGNGTIVGDVDVQGGTVIPGTSPGTLHIDGDLRLGNGGVIEIEIAPDAHDLLDVSGSVTFTDGAVIKLIFINGAAPAAEDSIAFIDASSVVVLEEITFEVEGLEEGFTFDVNIASGVVEVVATNDGIPLAEAVLKPGETGGINPNSNQLFPLAILTTQVAPLFDAIEVDPGTVLFGPTPAKPIQSKTDSKDVDDDGDLDLRLWFRTKETGILCNDTMAELTGQTFAGTTFSAQVEILTEGCK